MGQQVKFSIVGTTRIARGWANEGARRKGGHPGTRFSSAFVRQPPAWVSSSRLCRDSLSMACAFFACISQVSFGRYKGRPGSV